jgi:hypothetical protein
MEDFMSKKYSQSDRKIMSDLIAADAVNIDAITRVMSSSGAGASISDRDVDFFRCGNRVIRIYKLPWGPEGLIETLKQFVKISKELTSAPIVTSSVSGDKVQDAA